ncbi:MAG: Nif3-like dinuclear metal center hexameric protein [Ectothiorhodospiraceae bacterium]|jgi:dinuclear metal center YbgI/SA1388 family protein|nr:Nif3-like dinuclear metal center hexameric protein [Ectothiorhodospiraceae bacterium]
MVKLHELVTFADDLLGAGAFNDYCPNGLQVEGRSEVRRLASGVTACRALIEAAADFGADAILVHHGFFWRGEDARVVGMKRDRLRSLLAQDMSLIAYHLPLDAHAELGNNAQLAQRLGWQTDGTLGSDGIGLHGRVEGGGVDAAGLADRLERVLGRRPLHIAGGPAMIRTVGWCTGAAQGHIDRAVALGLDAYVSGEISEQTVHVAREAGIHYFAAGHHATERYGVQSFGAHLAERFGLEHRFFDIDNPV